MSPDLFLTFFAKAIGFFCLSPFFRWLHVPFFVRFGLALIISILVTPTMTEVQIPNSLFFVNLFKEAFIGYLLGFIFSLLFEAGALAGEIVGSMMGLSLSEIFDPVSNTTTPLMSRFFTLVIVTIFFSLDLHHDLIKVLFESNRLNLATIMDSTTFLFSQMFHFALIPFFFLTTLLISLAIAARLFPDFPIFWLTFPAQLVVGLIAVCIGMGHFPQVIKEGFSHLLELIKTGIIIPLM